MKYTPNHTYKGKIHVEIKGDINFRGDDTIIAKLVSRGITQPIKINMIMEMGGHTKSGAASPDGSFPLTLRYKFNGLTMDINGKSIPVPAEKFLAAVSLHGRVGADGKIKADSIGGVKIADTSKAHLGQMMNTIQRDIKFPDHHMRIGEVFTQNMPLNIPIAGNNIDADSKATYKLVGVVNGNANFDIIQTMDITIPISGGMIHLVGTGSGKMVYSIKNNFVTDYNAPINMTVTGSIKTLQINAKAQMNMEYKYAIN